MKQTYRHEIKHGINDLDMLIIRQRLRAVMKPDNHAEGGKYTVRSLYFDNIYDKALKEKINGVNDREKFRIRLYNGDTSVMRLEKKCKTNGLGTKYFAPVTAEETEALLKGDTDWMLRSEYPLIRELHAKMQYQGLRPKTIVEYTREPFVYGPGNVRVAMDYDLRVGLSVEDFLEKDCPTVPAGDTPAILEVKWDAFLPDVIRDAVQLTGRRAQAFSKYAQCRIYG